MLTQDTIDAFNGRLTIDLNSIKNMTTGELDRVKAHGSTAEILMRNRELAMFMHQYKFELADALSAISGHTLEDNNKRVAISNQLAGLDGFIATLKRAVYMKNRVVTQQNGPALNNKESKVL